MPTTKKMGRPTNNPKVTRITVRMDEETSKILDNYCEQENVERAEAVRRGIKGLKNVPTNKK